MTREQHRPARLPFVAWERFAAVDPNIDLDWLDDLDPTTFDALLDELMALADAGVPAKEARAVLARYRPEVP